MWIVVIEHWGKCIFLPFIFSLFVASGKHTTTTRLLQAIILCFNHLSCFRFLLSFLFTVVVARACKHIPKSHGTHVISIS